MPEGDTVWNTARVLEKALVGDVLTGSDFRVPKLGRTVRLAQKLLASNKGRWTQTTTGSLRRGETSYVYGRKAQPCRRCGTAIRKADLDERVTYWCPYCQPEPGQA